MEREAIAVTSGDVYLLKWFDDRDREHPVVRYELANRRGTDVPVRIEEVLPTSVTDDGDPRPAFGHDWTFDGGTAVFEGTLPAGETLVTGFGVGTGGMADHPGWTPAVTDRETGETLLSEGSSFQDVVLKVPDERPDPVRPAIDELVAALEDRTEATDDATADTDAEEDELIESLIERRTADERATEASDADQPTGSPTGGADGAGGEAAEEDPLAPSSEAPADGDGEDPLAPSSEAPADDSPVSAEPPAGDPPMSSEPSGKEEAPLAPGEDGEDEREQGTPARSANRGAPVEPTNPFVEDAAEHDDGTAAPADESVADEQPETGPTTGRPAGGPGAPPNPSADAADPLGPDTDIDGDDDRAAGDDEESGVEPDEEDGTDRGRPHRASGVRADGAVEGVAVPDEFDRGDLVDDFRYTELAVEGVDPRDVARAVTTGMRTILADDEGKYTVGDDDPLTLESLPVGTRTGTVKGTTVAVGPWMALDTETVDYGRGIGARAVALAVVGLVLLGAGGLVVVEDGTAASVAGTLGITAGTVGTAGTAAAALGAVVLGAAVVSLLRHPRGDIERTYYYREVHRFDFDGPVSERVRQRDGDTITDLYADLSIAVGTAVQVGITETGDHEITTPSTLPEDLRSTLTTDHDLVVELV